MGLLLTKMPKSHLALDCVQLTSKLESTLGIAHTPHVYHREGREFRNIRVETFCPSEQQEVIHFQQMLLLFIPWYKSAYSGKDKRWAILTDVTVVYPWDKSAYSGTEKTAVQPCDVPPGTPTDCFSFTSQLLLYVLSSWSEDTVFIWV